MSVLVDFNNLSDAQIRAMAEKSIKQDAEIAQLKAEAIRIQSMPLSMKVSEKGALSVYRLNARFPVTLYKEQWIKLIKFVPEIQKFISANEPRLKTKAQSVAEKAAALAGASVA